jgi:hypothetical protein
MYIKVNGDRVFEVTEENLVIKDDKLYNTQTKRYEGVDGDIVEFIRKDGSNNVRCRGTVDGYTCGSRVKIRGVDKVNEDSRDVSITHISSITDYDVISFEDKELLEAES